MMKVEDFLLWIGALFGGLMVVTEDVASTRVRVCGLATTVSAAPRVASSRRRSIGNRYLSDTTYQTGLEIAEVVHIPSVVTEAEMDALYTRAKSRAAARGLTVL